MLASDDPDYIQRLSELFERPPTDAEFDDAGLYDVSEHEIFELLPETQKFLPEMEMRLNKSMLKSAGVRIAMPMPTKADLPPGWSAKIQPGTIRHFGAGNVESRVCNENGQVVARVVITPAWKEPGAWDVEWSESAVKGWGAFAYEQAMEWVTAQGGWLQSDRVVSPSAVHVWDKYHARSVGGDIEARERRKREIFLPGEFTTDGLAVPHTSPSVRMQYRKKSSSVTAAPLTNEVVQVWADEVKARLGLQQFYVALQREGHLKLYSLIVPKDARGQGLGSQAMTALNTFADQHGVRVTLSPGQKDSYHGTTSHGRLVQFYKGHGYRENKGRSKDYALSDGMLRDPIKDDLLPKRIAMPMPTSLPEDWYVSHERGIGNDEEFILWSRKARVRLAIVVIRPTGPLKDNEWRVVESAVIYPAAKGYGPFVYEYALEWVTDRGGYLRSDVKVSDDAAKVWRKYDERAQKPDGDVERRPLDPDRLVEVWDYQNSRTVDRAHDGDWTTHSYRKRKQGTSERRVAMPMPTGLPPGYKMEIDTLLGVLTVVIRDVATNQVAAEVRAVGRWYSPINPREHKYVRNRTDAEQPGVVWAVQHSGATEEARKLGLGAYAYEQALRWISDHGGEMMSDDLVSDTAAHVWNKYYERAEAGELDMTERPREVERYRSSEPQDREPVVDPQRDMGGFYRRKEPSLQHSYRFPSQRRVR
jgi:GNAT superfamily N-acetyltransferase